jgi:hypothetical protein
MAGLRVKGFSPYDAFFLYMSRRYKIETMEPILPVQFDLNNVLSRGKGNEWLMVVEPDQMQLLAANLIDPSFDLIYKDLDEEYLSFI